MEHYGNIPVDETGRTYEIHHRDGQCANNHPDNLVALSIQDHFDIHLFQGDYGACAAIAIRMSLSSKEISEIASETRKIAWRNESYRNKVIMSQRNKPPPSQEHCRKLSIKGRELWSDPIYREKQLAAINKGAKRTGITVNDGISSWCSIRKAAISLGISRKAVQTRLRKGMLYYGQ